MSDIDRIARLALQVTIVFVLPVVIYDYLAPHGGEVHALLASSAPPLAWSLAEYIHRRQLDALSLLVLAGIVVSLLAVLGGGSGRFLLLREHVVTVFIGLVFLGSAALGKPLIYQLARARIARKSQAEAAALDAKRNLPHVRRALTLITLVWGVGLLGEAAFACALILTLPIHDYLVVSPFVSYGSFAILGAWSIWYRRRAMRQSD